MNVYRDRRDVVSAAPAPDEVWLCLSTTAPVAFCDCTDGERWRPYGRTPVGYATAAYNRTVTPPLRGRRRRARFEALTDPSPPTDSSPKPR